jgi:hypothetical protein
MSGGFCFARCSKWEFADFYFVTGGFCFGFGIANRGYFGRAIGTGWNIVVV